MRTVHRLLIIGWVPVAVVEDDRVSGCQVDTQTTSPGGKEERECVAVALEIRNHVPSLFHLGRPIKPQVLVSPELHVLL